MYKDNHYFLEGLLSETCGFNMIKIEIRFYHWLKVYIIFIYAICYMTFYAPYY